MSVESAKASVQQAKAGFAARRAEASRALFDRATLEDPDSLEAHYGAGLLALAFGDLDRAQAAFERARVLAPEHANTLYHLGLICEMKGDPNSAGIHYRAGLDASPGHGKLSQRLARLRRRLVQS